MQQSSAHSASCTLASASHCLLDDQNMLLVLLAVALVWLGTVVRDQFEWGTALLCLPASSPQPDMRLEMQLQQ